MSRAAARWIVAVVALAGCRPAESPPATDTSIAATTPPAPAPAAPAPVAPEPAAPGQPPASGATPLTADGWGPLRVGMTRREVVAALGEDANPDAVGGPDPAQCDEFRPARAPERMLVMVERGRLTRISLLSRSEVRTDRGIGVGDPASAVRGAYGDAAAASPHKYLPAPAEYLTVWRVAPPAAEARGIRYVTGTDGRVTHVHAGGPSIEYVEGCL